MTDSSTRSTDSARAHAERLVQALGCPRGSSLEEIRGRLSRVYGRPIVLRPVDRDELRTITGLWLETDAAGYVFFRAADPLAYQMHAIFHEFGHILGNHQGCDVLSIIADEELPAVGLGQQIRRAMARGVLQGESEVLAEEIAFALSRLVLAGPSPDVSTAFE